MIEARKTGLFERYLIEPRPEGAYLLIWESSESRVPEKDYLLDSLEDAKEVALEDFGVPLSSWRPYGGKGFFG